MNFEGKPFDKTIVKAGGLKVLAKTFTLPDITPGCIIEYQYRDKRDSNYYVNWEWIVQGDIYLRYGRFSILPYNGPAALPLAIRRMGIPAESKIEKEKNGYYSLEIRDIPGLDIEDYMPPADTLRARVEFFYRDRGEPDNESTDQYWQRTDKTFNEDIERFIDKKGALDKDVASTVSASDPPELKLQKIYDRVQKIRNLSFEGEKSAKEEHQEKLKDNSNVEDVLKHGYGYGRQINYLFLGLVRAAGFQANEVFVAPRNDRVFLPQMQDRSELSTELVCVNAGGKEYFLDPSARFFPFGLIPWSESQTGGLRVKKEGADLIMTPGLSPNSAELIRHAEIDVNDEGEAAGKIAVDFSGRYGAAWRTDDRDSDDAARRKDLSDDIKRWLPTDSTLTVTVLSNWDDTSKPLHVEGTVKIPSFGTTAGKRLLTPVEIFVARQPNSFKSETRKNDLDFYFPYKETDDVVLHLPKSYKLETLPQAQNINLGQAAYTISASAQGDGVEVKRTLMIGGALFPRANYPVFRDFFGKVKSDDQADVVLQNAETAKN